MSAPDSKYAAWLARPPLIVATQLAQQDINCHDTAAFFAYVLKNAPAQKLTQWCVEDANLH
jgi:hypothetical protein